MATTPSCSRAARVSRSIRWRQSSSTPYVRRAGCPAPSSFNHMILKGRSMSSDVVSKPFASLTILPGSLAPALHSVLRIATGLLFLEHGTGKLLGFPAGLPFIDQMPTGLLYVTGTLELVGGLLIVLGLFTRPAAFVLSGFMAVAYFMAHF